MISRVRTNEHVGNVRSRLEMDTIQQLLILGVITLFAAVLRFYKLGEWSLWGDEYITIRRALDVFDSSLRSHTISSMATNVSLNYWGVSEWSARLFAAIAGVATVPVCFVLVRKMFDPLTALIASLLLAISPWHLYWSQNARFYTILLLFYSAALFLFYFGIEEDRPWYLVASLGFLGLAFQERLIAGFFIPVSIAYVVLLRLLPFEKPPGLKTRNLALFYGPSIAGAAMLALSNSSVRDPSQWISSFGFVNNNPFWILGGVVFYMGIPLVTIGVLSAVYFLPKGNRAIFLLSLASVTPLIAVILISLIQYAANRYVFVSLLSVIGLSSIAIKELWQTSSRNVRMLSLGTLLILITSAMGDNVLYFQYQNGNRDNWKDAFALIERQKRDGDLVVTTHRALADYYMQEKTVSMQSVDDISRIVENQERVWFVIDLTAPDKAPQQSKWVRENARQVADFDVRVSARTFPMRIYLYEKG